MTNTTFLLNIKFFLIVTKQMLQFSPSKV